MIAYVDRSNISVALAVPDFKRLFHLTDQQRGTLNSAFFWSYAFLQIPAGWLVDRYGVKIPYAIAFLFWSLISAATGLAESVSQFVALRVMLGVGESVVTPASMRWIRFHFDEKDRGLAVGLFMSGTKFGPAIGAPMAAWLIAAYGWRPMFFVLGLGCLVWLIPWFLLIGNDDRQIEQRETVRKTAPARMPFGRIMASPVIWGTIIGTFCYMYFVYFCMTWMPAYFVERRHLSLTSMGLYTFFSFSGMAAMAALAGWAADRMIARGGNAVRVRKAFTIAGFLMASTEVIGGLSDSVGIALFFAVFSLTGLGLATANYWALTQTLIPGGAIGRIVGIQNCAANLPGILAPILTGWLKETTGRYDAPIQATWVFLIVGILAYVFLVREKYAPIEVSS
jgi:ACS family D-galactonate transporter-like MFS transporter